MRAISCAALFASLLSASDSLTSGGIEAFRQGRFADASTALEKAVAAQPADRHAQTFLALTRAALGRCPEAMPELERASRAQEPGLARLAGLALVNCHLAGQQMDLASAALARLRQAYPSDADVLYTAAKLHRQAWDDALSTLFQKAPDSYRVNQLSAEVFETQGNYAEAAAEYAKAIAKNPAGLNLHYRRGRALLLQSHAPEMLPKARQEFEAELRLNPSDAVAEYQIAQILMAEGQRAAAATRLERAVVLRPDFAEGLLALGKLRAEEKQYPLAVELMERAVRIQPQNEAAHYSLMLAYRDAGRGADARREKATLDRLQKPPEGEFTDFLKRIGEKTPKP